MAKLNSETIEIKISELVRDDVPTAGIINDETLLELLAVIEQLVGEKRLVEVNIK